MLCGFPPGWRRNGFAAFRDWDNRRYNHRILINHKKQPITRVSPQDLDC
jgi:hypothetical protein